MNNELLTANVKEEANNQEKEFDAMTITTEPSANQLAARPSAIVPEPPKPEIKGEPFCFVVV
jgi:hypothetical protein